jgi:hypothetical protein
MAAGGAYLALRAHRLYRIGTDLHRQVRLLIQNGDTVGGVPTEEALAVSYLDAIFGDNPELLDRLKGIVRRGLADVPRLNLGEVTAMLVTYRRSEEGVVEGVAAHVMGGFPLGRRRPGMHRDGYFRHLVDRRIWNAGNIAIGLLGRDMVIFSDTDIKEQHDGIIEEVFNGRIDRLVGYLDRPLHFTMVFPDPRRIVPPQLRNHVQAIVLKGFISPQEGEFETIILTPSQRSAAYTLGVIGDMKRAGEVALQTKWHGVMKQTEWGPVVDTW